MSQIVQPSGQPDGSRPDAFRREAVPLSNLRPAFLAVVVSDHSHADPFGRTTLQMSHVQEGLLRLVHADQTHANSQRRKALPVQIVSVAVLAVRQLEPAHAGPFGHFVIRPVSVDPRESVHSAIPTRQLLDAQVDAQSAVVPQTKVYQLQTCPVPLIVRPSSSSTTFQLLPGNTTVQ